MNLPKVGQTVLVRRRSNQKAKALLTSAKGIVQDITKVYIGGHICTSSGDIWEVEPLPTHKADWVTKEAAAD